MRRLYAAKEPGVGSSADGKGRIGKREHDGAQTDPFARGGGTSALLTAQDTNAGEYDRDVRRSAQMHGGVQRQALRDLLLGDLKTDTESVTDSIFRYERELRPALVPLLDDKTAGELSAQVLILIGEHDDLRRIIAHPPPAGADGDDDGWVYAAVSSLVDPSSEEEWEFVRKCALGEYTDPWAERGAIQTLKLTASARSRTILEEMKKRGSVEADSLDDALAYINSAPSRLEGSDLEALSSRVAGAVRMGYWTWIGNGKPVYNEARDKALVASLFAGNMDSYIYASTFHEAKGIWKLCAVRETMQSAGPPPLPPAAVPRDGK